MLDHAFVYHCTYQQRNVKKIKVMRSQVRSTRNVNKRALMRNVNKRALTSEF